MDVIVQKVSSCTKWRPPLRSNRAVVSKLISGPGLHLPENKVRLGLECGLD